MVAFYKVSRPKANQPIVDNNGIVTRPWYRFFEQMFGQSDNNQVAINVNTPPGSIMAYGGPSAPTGFLVCNGQTVSRTTFSDLFNAIGETYGAGDGSTTFQLPDGRGRSLIGAGAGPGLTNRSRGDEGGEESVVLTESNLAPHNHAVTDPGHIHTVTDPGHGHMVADPGHGHAVTDPMHTHTVTDPGHTHAALNNFVTDGAGTEYDNTNGDKGVVEATTQSSTTGVTVDPESTGVTVNTNTTSVTVNTNTTSVTVDNGMTGITTQNTGGGTAHENMPPFFVCNWIIKT